MRHGASRSEGDRFVAALEDPGMAGCCPGGLESILWGGIPPGKPRSQSAEAAIPKCFAFGEHGPFRSEKTSVPDGDRRWERLNVKVKIQVLF